MEKTYHTYCRGKRCLLRTNCNRYLCGQRLPANNQENWIDHCDEETRQMFDPDKKSENK